MIPIAWRGCPWPDRRSRGSHRVETVLRQRITAGIRWESEEGMRRLLSVIGVLSIIAIVGAACAGETEVVREIVTVEVERVVERVVEKEVVVEKIVTVEVEVERVVEKEVLVEKEVVREIEVQKIVEVEQELSGALAAEAARYGGTLRVAAAGSIASLDVSFTGAGTTSRVVAHMWERLFERDADFQPQPMMVDTWTVSPDGATYTFTLRDGLLFHDLTEVKSDDVIGSMQRMWVTQAGGGFLSDNLAEGGILKIDDLTFSLTFQTPLGVVIDGLAAPWPLSNIWPKRITDEFAAQQDHGEENAIGSGPYKLAEWDRGARLSLERFEEYQPRTEPASDLAGRKAAYLDRIDWIEVPNEETKVAGLKTGEWDILDTGGLDFLLDFQSHPEINVEFGGPVVSTLDFNVTSVPADNRLVRQAIQAAIDVETFMFGLGPRELWDLCPARYFCDTPWASDAGSEFYDTNDMEEAQRLLAESGYAGETFFFMNPTDYAILTPLGLIARPMLEEIGLNVDMPAMDWATLLSKFPDPDWDLFPDGWGLVNLPDPVGDSMVSGTLYFGNYGKSDMIARVKDIRLRFALETDPVKQKALVDELQIAIYEDVPQIRLGVFRQFHGYRNNVKNFVVNTQALFHNVFFQN